MVSLLLCAVCVLIAWCSFKVWKSYQNPAWSKIPGPSHTLPLIGNYLDLMKNDVSVIHSKWAEQYGPIFRYYSFGNVVLMVSDPAIVKYILLNEHLFDKDLIHYQLLRKVFGTGLVTQTDGTMHKHHRNIISPAFAHKHLRALVPIYHEKARYLVEDWLKLAGTGSLVSIKDYIARATSDVIGEAAFGYHLNSQRDNSSSSVYSIFANVAGQRVNLFLLMPGIKMLFPQYYRMHSSIKALKEQVENIIDQKAERRNKKQDSESEAMRDLLDIMMDSESEDGRRLSREELADQTKTFLLAGYETSSVCILWTMYLLARHPAIQQRVADEIISVIGKDNPPTAEDIDKMPYLYQVLRESLRICPPIPFVFRHVAEDVKLGDYDVPKGTLINVNIFHMHHHSPVWKNHEEFDPERWAGSDAENNLLGSYLPFIMGARNCIGSRFAMLEVRIMLAMIIQKLKFTPEPGQKEARKTCFVAMVPRDPIRVIFEARK